MGCLEPLGSFSGFDRLGLDGADNTKRSSLTSRNVATDQVINYSQMMKSKDAISLGSSCQHGGRRSLTQRLVGIGPANTKH